MDDEAQRRRGANLGIGMIVTVATAAVVLAIYEVGAPIVASWLAPCLVIAVSVWRWRMAGSTATRSIVAVLAMATVAFLCAAHVVYGGRGGVHLCWKYGWTPDDTFVDLDVFDREHRPPPKLGEALERCLR